MKIAYIGIDFLSSALDALIENGCEIVEMFTCKTDNKTEFNTKITAEAKRLDVPMSMARFNAEDIKRLEQKNCDAIICAGYYYKIPVSSAIPMINVHPSYLPMGRGAWPMPVCLLKGLTYGGVTLHKVADKFDEGDIILQENFELSEKDNLQTYMAKADKVIHRLINRLINDFNYLYSHAVPQSKGEYWRCPIEEDWTVTHDMSFEKADRIFRAFYGYECILDCSGKKYELIRAEMRKEKPLSREYIKIKNGYILADEIIELGDNTCDKR